MQRPFDIQDRSFLFATEIVDFCKPMMPPGGVVRELSRQLLRAGTSIGANLEEADAGQTKPDFRALVQILTTIKLNSERNDDRDSEKP